MKEIQKMRPAAIQVRVLLQVYQSLIGHGATVIVIEHDLDIIRNADYLIDMGPGGGTKGGRIVCVGTQDDLRRCSDSLTGKYL